MTDAATETLSVVVERELPFAPDRVWRALTQPHLIEEWLMKNDFKPVVGHGFQLRAEPNPRWSGIIDCEVLVVEPNKALSYTWGGPGGAAADSMRTIVAWTLTPTSTGTHLRMEHSGFRPDRLQNYNGAKYGWRRFFANLEQMLARTD